MDKNKKNHGTHKNIPYSGVKKTSGMIFMYFDLIAKCYWGVQKFGLHMSRAVGSESRSLCFAQATPGTQNKRPEPLVQTHCPDDITVKEAGVQYLPRARVFLETNNICTCFGSLISTISHFIKLKDRQI